MQDRFIKEERQNSRGLTAKILKTTRIPTFVYEDLAGYFQHCRARVTRYCPFNPKAEPEYLETLGEREACRDVIADWSETNIRETMVDVAKRLGITSFATHQLKQLIPKRIANRITKRTRRQTSALARNTRKVNNDSQLMRSRSFYNMYPSQWLLTARTMISKEMEDKNWCWRIMGNEA